MEKIKNFLSGHNDESTTHESGTHSTGTSSGKTTGIAGEESRLGKDTQTTGHTTGIGGAGNHLGKDTTPGGPLSGQHGVGNTGNTGLGGRNTADEGISRSSGGGVLNSGHNSGLTGQADDGVPRGAGGGILNSSGNNSGSIGQGSHLGNTRDTTHTGTTSGLNETGHTHHDGCGHEGFGNTRDSTRTGATSGLTGSGREGTGNTSGLTGSGLGHTHHSGVGHEGASRTGEFGDTGRSGPHRTEAANRLDPNLDSGRNKTEDAFNHSHEHGGGAEQADKHHSGGPKTAAPGYGTGVNEHEHDRHQGTTGVGSTGIGSSTNQHDTTGSGSHLGRDAAIGAGGVGLAEHEHKKHETQGNTGVGSSGIHSEHQPGAVAGLDGPAPNTAGPHKQDWLNKLDPRVTANPETSSTGHGPFKVSAADYPPGTSKPYDPTTGYTANPAHHGIKSVNPEGSTTNTANVGHHGGSTADTLPDRSAGTKDRHLGRDAAVAGGVGGAAYEAEKHHDKHNTTTAGDHKHNKESKGAPLSFLNRDKNKKYTKEEEHEFDRQERDHNSSHKGTAALGGAAAGGVAHSQYKSDQHQHATTGHGSDKALPTAPGNHGIGTGAGTGNALAGEGSNLHGTEGQGRQGSVGLAETPVGKDLGDTLHGVDRNRGVTGSSGFPGTEGFGDGSPTTGTHSGVGHTGTHTGEQSHLGRDAAVGAGGIGAAHHPHSYDAQPSNPTSQQQYSSGQTGQHSTGLGSSALGGESEYRKTDTTSGLQSHHGQESGITGNQSSGITGNQSSGITGSHGLTGSDDRNRLHKDPPTGHVPASGSERERLVAEGERGIGHDTGVAGSHSNAPNTGTNY